MASKKYTGKFKRGQIVTFSWFTPAISCQSCHQIKGRGKITHTERAEGTTMYAIDGTLLFEQEIKRVVGSGRR